MRKVLVYGLGVTGISTVKTLSKMGYLVYTYDKNKVEDDKLMGYDYSPISSGDLFDIEYGFVVKSPGIPPSDHIAKRLYESYEVISDIELSFRLFPDKKVIAITGSNGKTTTTSLICHILNESGKKAYAVGNIGEGILWQMYNNEGIFVCELSSFQLEDVKKYHPKFALILNISPDHVDWHGSYEAYIRAKLNIAINQDKEDIIIINSNNEVISDNKSKFNANIYEFSIDHPVDRGIFIEDGTIYLRDKDKDLALINTRDLLIIGDHNYENVMAASLLSYLYGIDISKIRSALKSFKSIKHRLEYVDTISGIRVYNDSKATNVDSAIRAINSFDTRIILIAGGYDKKIDYKDFVKAFKKNGKLMVLMGESKLILKSLCEKYNIPYKIAKNMREAVKACFENAKIGDVILLSPASASWDMYKSYEKRGEDFIREVKKYKED